MSNFKEKESEKNRAGGKIKGRTKFTIHKVKKCERCPLKAQYLLPLISIICRNDEVTLASK